MAFPDSNAIKNLQTQIAALKQSYDTLNSTLNQRGKHSFDKPCAVPARYAMISHNTSTPNIRSLAYFNENFGVVGTNGNASPTSNDGVWSFQSGTSIGVNTFFLAAWGTQLNPSSGATTGYINSTNAIGEFGNAMLDIYAYSRIPSIPNRMGMDWQTKHYLNNYAISSSHANRKTRYILFNGKLRCVNAVLGNHLEDYPGTTAYTIPNLNASMVGAADYNATRKELVVLSQTAAGVFNCMTFANVDFNTTPDPTAALTGITPTVVSVTLPTFATNNNESNYGLHPFLTDNGKVFVSAMYTSDSLKLYSFQRSSATITATIEHSTSLAATYGRDAGIHYGRRQITSEDGQTIISFCPSAAYGAGIAADMVARNGQYQSVAISDTTYGYQPLPTGKSDWAIVYCGNGYASNNNGNYIAQKWIMQNGAWTQTGSTIYFQQHTAPDTTNSPGFGFVLDGSWL